MSTLRRNSTGYVAQIVILISALSLFLPHYIASAVIVCVGAAFCILPGTRDKIFIHKGAYILLAFTVITGIVAIVNKNTTGIVRTGIFAMMMTVSFVARGLATRRFYERMLDMLVLGGTLSTAGSIIEKILFRDIPGYRCKALFVNPNFFGTAIMLVILICAYKAVIRAKNVPIYYLLAVFNAVGIYLCGSMALWFILFIGILVLLLLNHEYRMLAVFLAVVAVICTAIVLVPHIIPRLHELSDTTVNRVKIWGFAIEQIKKAPIFGHGFSSYKFLYNQLSPTRPDIYKASLAHNILFECLLSHGIVGTVLVGAYIMRFFKSMLECHDELKRRGHSYVITTFISAVAAAIACYGMIDTTMVWPTTGMIILMIISGIGIDERKLRHIRHTEQSRNKTV